MPLILAFGRQRQADISEFQDSQGYAKKSCLSKIKQGVGKERGRGEERIFPWYLSKLSKTILLVSYSLCWKSHSSDSVL